MSLLKLLPYSPAALTELRPVLVELGDLTLCAQLFQAAFDHWQHVHPLGPNSAAVDRDGNEPTSLSLLDLLVLADLYNSLGLYERAITAIRRGARWLQGRGADRFWDACPDDREWDIRLQGEGDGAAITRTREGNPPPGYHPLDVNARHRLAIARIKLEDFDEGKVSRTKPSDGVLWSLIDDGL